MNIIEAFLLGTIQGITEFLPISSSGHLLLAQRLLGMGNPKDYLLFDVICHCGTLLAIIAYYFRQLIALTRSEGKLLMLLALATLPLMAVPVLLPYIERAYAAQNWMGYAFLITAVLLWIGHRQPHKKESSARSFGDALIVGCFQAAAILPGISRSGITISGARLRGWSTADAVSFSFLLAIPTILGGLCFEVLRMVIKTHPPTLAINWIHYTIGFGSSFAVGCLSITLATRLIKQDGMLYFAWYCLIIGLFCLWWF